MEISDYNKNFKFAFANNFEQKNNYAYFKSIEKPTLKTIENENRHKVILDNLRKKKIYNRTSNVVWICKKCGYVHIGVDAPSICPICVEPQTSFILQASNY